MQSVRCVKEAFEPCTNSWNKSVTAFRQSTAYWPSLIMVNDNTYVSSFILSTLLTRWWLQRQLTEEKQKREEMMRDDASITVRSRLFFIFFCHVIIDATYYALSPTKLQPALNWGTWFSLSFRIGRYSFPRLTGKEASLDWHKCRGIWRRIWRETQANNSHRQLLPKI